MRFKLAIHRLANLHWWRESSELLSLSAWNCSGGSPQGTTNGFRCSEHCEDASPGEKCCSVIWTMWQCYWDNYDVWLSLWGSITPLWVFLDTRSYQRRNVLVSLQVCRNNIRDNQSCFISCTDNTAFHRFCVHASGFRMPHTDVSNTEI